MNDLHQANLAHNWPEVDSNRPVNHNNEEQLPGSNFGETFHDVAVGDKKKDGKNTIEKETESSTEEKSSDDYDNEEEETTKPTQPPKKKLRKHKKTQKNIKQQNEKPVTSKNPDDSAVQQMKIVHSKLQVEFADHDGNAEQPGGAVLSLTLGTTYK